MTFPNGETRAYVDTDYSHFQGISIYLAHKLADGSTAFGQPTEVVFEATPEGVQVPPTFRMPADVGRALLDALAAHYGGTSEVQTLRKDFLHERGRVDKLIGTLSAIATGIRVAS